MAEISFSLPLKTGYMSCRLFSSVLRRHELQH